MQVVDHLSAAELQAGWRGSKDATLARHYQVIWLLAQGGVSEVAGLTRFVRRWVEELLARYNRFGQVVARRSAPRATARSRRILTRGDPGDASGAGGGPARRRRGLDREEGGGSDRGGARARPRRRAARLGGLARNRLDDPAPAAAARAGGDARGAGGVQKKLAEAVAEEAERHPGATIETFATDEHRIGLKPILRRVWAPRGQRPIARGHHRFEWLYVTAFVSPATGESFWYLSTGVDKALFEDTLALFAREAGAGRDRIIILVLDGAGWHTSPSPCPTASVSSICRPTPPSCSPPRPSGPTSTSPSSTATSTPSPNRCRRRRTVRRPRQRS